MEEPPATSTITTAPVAGKGLLKKLHDDYFWAEINFTSARSVSLNEISNLYGELLKGELIDQKQNEKLHLDYERPLEFDRIDGPNVYYRVKDRGCPGVQELTGFINAESIDDCVGRVFRLFLTKIKTRFWFELRFISYGSLSNLKSYQDQCLSNDECLYIWANDSGSNEVSCTLFSECKFRFMAYDTLYDEYIDGMSVVIPSAFGKQFNF